MRSLLWRLRASPIAVLTSIEAAATLVAVLFDVWLTAFVSPYDAILHPVPLILGAIVTTVCVAATFTIPHRADRRRLSIVVAVVTLPVVGYLPPHGMVAIVLAGILASRLAFRYGFRGGVVAWLAGTVAIGFRVAAQTAGIPESSVLLEQIYSIGTWATLLGLLSGLLAFADYYAKAAAEAAASRERSRIALDLHDALGHGLTTLAVQLESAHRLRGGDATKADDYVRRAIATTASLLADVRETVGLLLADNEPPESFVVLLERLFTDFSATHLATVRWSVEAGDEPEGAVAVAVYRVAQEALTNVARHARANEVDASVTVDERGVTVVVSDDGQGFSGPGEGNGLRSMRERVASVGGNLTIETQPGRGTTIRARMPRVYVS